MPKLGCFTPSRFADAMTNGRGKDTIGKTAYGLAYEVAMQRLGVQREEIHAPALDWGNEWEPQAILRYEKETFQDVERVLAPLVHPVHDFVAGTPDGYVLDGLGLIEVKCPYNPQNHFLNVVNGEQIDLYKYQMQGYMWITGAEWCDFVSYDPRFPEHLRIKIIRVERDNDLIEQIETRILLLENYVNEILTLIQTQ